MIAQDESPLGLVTLSVILSVLFHAILVWMATFSMDRSPVVERKPIEPVQWVNLAQSLPNKKLVEIADQSSITQKNVSSKFMSDENRFVEKQTRSQNTSSSPTPPSGASAPQPKEISAQSLNLSEKELSKVLAQTQTPHTVAFHPNNYLPEIQVGDDTMLSTQKFAYATYFNRMKQAIAVFWHPSISTVSQNPYKKTWITKLLIVLDQEGELRDYMVIETSGSQSLDRHALQAVGQAAPFYNPPEVLLDDSDEIRMTWHFIFETKRF